ncbi:MAG: DUF2142 domain-containing protein [Oscillospiraceae bacterium]|nr:DUF2142 domain-containing protein [Oscillospiraceae bacterium]
MLKEKLESLNDGGTLKKGLLFSAFYLVALLFSLESTGFHLSCILVFLAASALIIFWCSRCFSLMKETEDLFAPLFLLCGSFYAAVLPITKDEIPAAGVISYGDGATFSRIFSLPAFWLMKLCGGSVTVSAYFARYVNLIFCAALLWFAVRSIPYCKTFSATVTLLPSAMRSFATASPQGTTLVTSMLFIALTLRAAYTRDSYILTRRYLFALTASALMMLFCNITAIPFVFLLLMIPETRYGSKNRRLSFFACIIAFVVLCVVLWSFGAAEAILSPIEGLSRSEQMEFVLSHPLFYITAFVRTIFTEGMRILSEIFVTIPVAYTTGSEIHLPWVFALSFILCCIYTGFFDSGLSPRRERIIRSTTLSTLIFIICHLTFYYLARTPLGNDVILGIDGGVMLPVFLPACLLLKRLSKHPAAPQKNFTESFLIISLANIASALYFYFSV